jgi:cell fate regulator YaaT (PSP1 superfamily)
MPKVVGIKFRNSAKVYYFSSEGFEDLQIDDFVIVDTARGKEAGRVAFVPREVPDKDIRNKLKGIMRVATAIDLAQAERYQQREKQALHRCRDKVSEYNLLMKVIRAEYNFDGTHLTFYFTADKRVDFRALVKDLAHSFKTRIELRQVGVRDEVKLVGGYGLCGRPHCCSTWLSEFRPISIRMAKQQDLPLSPMEISGVCGRLLCCLAYENDMYAEIKKRMPRVGQTITTPKGTGKVTGLNAIQETVTVRVPGGTLAAFSLEELDTPEREPETTQRRRRGRKRKK